MARKKKETSLGVSDKPKNPQELKQEGVQNLYNFLFEACNIIRGPVSQDNFKDYITPILYYKRISDVYDEETLDALQESGGDEDLLRFQNSTALSSLMAVTGRMYESAPRILVLLSWGQCVVLSWPILTPFMVYSVCSVHRNGRTRRIFPMGRYVTLSNT